MGSKLMGYKEFLASPDFARRAGNPEALRESKVPSSASSSPEFEFTGREALRLKKDPLKDRKNIDPNLRAARAIRDNSAVTAAISAAMAARKSLFELDQEYPFPSSLLEQAPAQGKTDG